MLNGPTGHHSLPSEKFEQGLEFVFAGFAQGSDITLTRFTGINQDIVVYGNSEFKT